MADYFYAGLSFEQVVRKYKDTVGKVCIVRLKNYADAQDCFQNVFSTLYTKSPSFESEDHLKAWLIRVAINECKNHIRNNKPLLPLCDVTENAVEFEYDKCDVSWALLQLTPKYRNVLYLHYIERYKISEIAVILEKSENTVKSLLKRGRKKLKEILRGDDI